MANKGTYTVTRTSTVRIVVNKMKDEKDGERQALRLAKLFLSHDDRDEQERKEELEESKNGMGLDSGPMKGRAIGYKFDFELHEDEDVIIEDEEHGIDFTELKHGSEEEEIEDGNDDEDND